jgi:hypothetical protein
MNSLERAAIRRLRTGVVPSWELTRLSVGYGKATRAVQYALEVVTNGERPDALFVQGEWGSGKTHFLSFVRELTSSRGVPCARVDLNARSTPLNYPQRFYESIAETVRIKDRAGMRGVLMGILEDDSTRQRLSVFSRSSAAGDLQGPLLTLCSRFERGERLELADSEVWRTLFGADLSWADYTYKREQALNRIECLGRMFDFVGAAGLVLVFDEAETIDQLWNVRSRVSAYGVLGQLLRSKYLWCSLGITERFAHTLEMDFDRGVLDYGFTGESASWFLRAWRRSQFTVLEPPVIDTHSARTLAAAVSGLYASAYPDATVDAHVVERCVADWAKNPSRNPRRLIRLLIHHLDIRRALPGAGEQAKLPRSA